MSEAVRAVALAEANKHHQGQAEPKVVVNTATAFLAFLQADSSPGTRSAAGAEPAAKPATNKPAAGKPATDPKKAAAEKAKADKEAAAAKAALDKANAEDGGEEEYVFPTEPLDPSDEASVGKIVEAFIKSDRRQEAIDLLGKYKAKGVSKLVEKGEATIAKFVADGNVALGLAEADDGDLS